MLKDLEASPGSTRGIARWQKAQQFLVNGRPDQAREIYQELLKEFPDTARMWYELGFAAGKQLDFTLADEAGQRAAALAAKNVSLLVLIGQQYHWLRQPDRARACFEQAVAAAPNSIHAQLSLADWYERERRLDDAWKCVEACVARDPQNAQVLVVKALLLQRRGLVEESEKLLREIIKRGSADANVNYSARHQLAVALDQMGQYADALHWLGEAKALLRKVANVGKMEQEYDRAVRQRRELLGALTARDIEGWRKQATPMMPLMETMAGGSNRLAFLGGHPRTGTTLLEQILGAHPGIESFDEPMAFADEVAEKLAPMSAMTGLTVKGLNGLSAEECHRFRQRYFKSLLRDITGGAVQEKPTHELLLDKNPSPTAWLHLWLRIFPKLKVIIALRDPRDVMVSCYFQNLRLNATNANFLTLERTAKHYADLMDVWLRMRELGGFEWIESRYEDTVTNLEAEGKRVTEFLGLAWHAQQAAFQETNRKKFVFSPNYTDVKGPVYQRAVGRWKNYAGGLEPIQEKLAVYCRKFGYEV